MIKFRSAIRGDAVAPIEALPAEILLSIFYIVLVDNSLPICLPKITHCRLIGQMYLLPLIHVCKTWRELALNSSTLWSGIDCKYSARFIDASLIRSGSRQLSVYVPLRPGNIRDVDDFLRAHGDRLYNLHLHALGVDPAYDQLMYPVTGFGASQLACLTYAGTEQYAIDHPEPPSLRALFDNGVSSLKALALAYNGLWLPCNSFPRLTHLYLYPGYCDHVPLSPWFDRLLNMLSNAPTLQTLHVMPEIWDEPEALPLSPPLRPPVALPNLQTLTLEKTSYRAVWYLLDRLSMPQETLVRLHWCRWLFEDGFRPTVDVSRYLPRYPDIEVSLLDMKIDVVATDRQSNAGLWVLVPGDSEQRLLQLSNLQDIFPVAFVQNMRIYVDHRHASAIAQVLPLMLSLKELCVRVVQRTHRDNMGMFITRICDALGSRDTLACPELRLLGIEADMSNEEVTSMWTGDLVNMAARRNRAGCRLSRVALQLISDVGSVKASEFDLRTLVTAEGPLSNLEQHVDTVELRGTRDPRLSQCPFKLNDRWKLQEATKYWELERMPDWPAYERRADGSPLLFEDGVQLV